MLKKVKDESWGRGFWRKLWVHGAGIFRSSARACGTGVLGSGWSGCVYGEYGAVIERVVGQRLEERGFESVIVTVAGELRSLFWAREFCSALLARQQEDAPCLVCQMLDQLAWGETMASAKYLCV
jgi:hypothetical protein